MDKTDVELWQDVQDGVDGAWNVLIERFQALVYSVVIRAGLSSADAADCFQQTWVLLYKNRKRIKDPARLSAWLVTTAKREALRTIRKSRRFMADEPSRETPADDPLPSEALERLELQAELERALKQIDSRCRALLQAIFFSPESQSYADIAADLGLAVNSLGPIRQRCLKRLRQRLEENGYLPVRKGDE